MHIYILNFYTHIYVYFVPGKFDGKFDDSFDEENLMIARHVDIYKFFVFVLCFCALIQSLMVQVHLPR